MTLPWSVMTAIDEKYDSTLSVVLELGSNKSPFTVRSKIDDNFLSR